MPRDISQLAVEEFLERFHSRERLAGRQRHNREKTISAKSEMLIPMRKMLKHLVDAQVYVTHHAMHEQGHTARNITAPQQLLVYESESSPRWQPGESLFLDHPARIEIAIPNTHQRQHEGVVVVACSTPHPHDYLLRGPFVTMEEACVALARFLSESTVRIDSDPLSPNGDPLS